MPDVVKAFTRRWYPGPAGASASDRQPDPSAPSRSPGDPACPSPSSSSPKSCPRRPSRPWTRLRGSATATAPTAPSCCRPRRGRCGADPQRDHDRRRGAGGGAVLKVVARAGVGLDNVDVPAATQAGVMVVNAPQSNIVSAAELAIGLLIATARNIARARLAQGRGVEAVQVHRRRAAGQGARRRRPRHASASWWPSGCRASACASSPTTPTSRPSRAAQIGVRLVTLDDLLAAVRLHHRAPAQDARDRRAHR